MKKNIGFLLCLIGVSLIIGAIAFFVMIMGNYDKEKIEWVNKHWELNLPQAQKITSLYNDKGGFPADGVEILKLEYDIDLEESYLGVEVNSNNKNYLIDQIKENFQTESETSFLEIINYINDGKISRCMIKKDIQFKSNLIVCLTNERDKEIYLVIKKY